MPNAPEKQKPIESEQPMSEPAAETLPQTEVAVELHETQEPPKEEPSSEQPEREEEVSVVVESSGPRRRPVPAAPAVPKDPVTSRIEEFLSEDLTDVFLGMSPEKQVEFKRKGEETASRIRQMLASAHVNAKKIFELIREWLKLIPGVNRFFLEQEAKIKTDKILKIRP